MIKIKESGEKLVLINQDFHELIVDLVHKEHNANQAYLRKTLAEKLDIAQKKLGKKYTLVINSAYRSPDLQKAIYENQLSINKDRYPNWAEEKILKETQKYVAPWKGPNISAHATGGAVDVQLWDCYSNSRVTLKSDKLSLKENALTEQPKLPDSVKQNRKMLIKVLQDQNLYNYKYEFWHWTYGERTWAMSKGKKETIYGPIKDKSKYIN